ncbi:hypothetical protein ABVK25_000311 [Lepraria finkii]|uniref:Uncharacterized protein n=1 Tax=Lepraria finkii TaxID=1340010 RepID=A0ABR4BMJ5_9LECA
MQDTVSFSVVSSHRQAVAYLHWLDPKEKHFYISYLKSYSTFEADSIRGCNNTIKNIIDNAEEPRKIKIGEALVTLEPIKGSWNPQPTATNHQRPTPLSLETPDPVSEAETRKCSDGVRSRRLVSFCHR